MKIIFHTNLDEAKRFIPDARSTEFTPVPAKGSHIRIPLGENERGREKTFDLEVVGVVYVMNKHEPAHIRVELHIPSHLGMSINEWTEWFKKRLQS